MSRGANLVLARGVLAGTWTRKAGSLDVVWLDGANAPDLDLLRQEATCLGALLGIDLAVNVTSS